MKSLLIPALFLVTAASGGCATVLKSKQAQVSVTSTTPGADVIINGNKVGVTPATFRLSHKNDHTIVVRGSGGEQTCMLRSGISKGWVVLDVVTLGGWLVDLVTSNWNSLDKTECTVAL